MDTQNIKEIIVNTIKQDYAFLNELLKMAEETLIECKENWELQQTEQERNNFELHFEYWTDTERHLGKKIRRFMLNNAINGFDPRLNLSSSMEAVFFFRDFLVTILEEIDFREVAYDILDIYKKDKKTKTLVYLNH